MTVRVEAGGMAFAALEWGPRDGPLALCLHGYPDSARTWRHLGPHLAERGFRVVAPWMRGYAPSDLAPDGCYQTGAIGRDANELHRALGGDERAVLIGHDWGAIAAYAAASSAPERWRRVVTMAVAPGPVAFGDRSPRTLPLAARQLRMSWYIFWQQLPGLSEASLGRVIPKLWRDWSPGYDPVDDLPGVFAALDTPERRTAALRYYRALLLPWMRDGEYAAEQAATWRLPPQPLLYLHGADDGCQLPEVARRAEHVLSAPSRFAMIAGAGHFLQLERPDEVNALVADFVGL